jgi:ubiquinone/menaquinone biosynthesis C-methylase UbiE
LNIVVDNWKQRASVYDNLRWTAEDELLKKIHRFSGITRESMVLDVGTGTGILPRYLSPLCHRVYAVDVSRDMLNIAVNKNNGLNISYQVMDATDLLFMSGFFDCVVSRMCFHHINDRVKAMNECLRVLKPGGEMIICEVVPPIGSYDFYVDMFKLKEERFVFTPDGLISMLNGVGLVDIDFSFYTMKDVSIRNWLGNSGLSVEVQDIIFKMWYGCPGIVRDGHGLVFVGDDILVRWLFMIVKGKKE